VKPTVVFLLWKNLDQISGVTSWVLALKPILERLGYSVKIALERPDPQAESDRVDYCVQDGEALVQALLECSPAVLVAMNISFHKPFANAVTEANGRGGRVHLISVLHADAEYYEPLEFFDRHTHCFLAVSQKIRTKVEEKLPWRAGMVKVMPYSVNCPPIKPRVPERGVIRLAYAGRFVQHKKRSLDLIPLVKELERMEMGYRFSIIGDGPEMDTLQKALSDEVRDSKVVFTGRLSQDRMKAIWKNNDIFVNVSAFEGTSVSMLEAMAAGCVPVVTRVSGVDDIIVAGENGIHVPIGDMQYLAALIEDLSFNRESLAEMGNAAHQTIASYFSIHDYARQFLTLLGEIAAIDPLCIPGHCKAMPEVLSNGDLAVQGNGSLTVHTIFTDEHRAMMNEWFLGTMRDDWSVYAHYAGRLSGIESSNYGSKPYFDLLKRRVILVIQSVKDHWGESILWMDADVQFFARCSKIVEDTLKNHDIAFQSEWSVLESRPHWQVCCGIMAMRGGAAILDQSLGNALRSGGGIPAWRSIGSKQIAGGAQRADQGDLFRRTLLGAESWKSAHGGNCRPPCQLHSPDLNREFPGAENRPVQRC
jgi:glycosyltransferase involved in cell wall biosynthesis